MRFILGYVQKVKTSRRFPQTKMTRAVIISIVLLMVFFLPACQVGNDRLMTDEVDKIEGSITRINRSASQGDFDAIKPGLKMIERSWMSVKAELQVRNENSSIDRFEEAFKSVGESLKTENKSAIIEEIEGLSATFDNVIKSLEKVDVNNSSLFIRLGFAMLVLLAGFPLVIVVAQMMKRGKIRL